MQVSKKKKKTKSILRDGHFECAPDMCVHFAAEAEAAGLDDILEKIRCNFRRGSIDPPATHTHTSSVMKEFFFPHFVFFFLFYSLGLHCIRVTALSND